VESENDLVLVAAQLEGVEQKRKSKRDKRCVSNKTAIYHTNNYSTGQKQMHKLETYDNYIINGWWSSMGLDYVSELRPPAGLLFIPDEKNGYRD
jgi:hypothetical protein